MGSLQSSGYSIKEQTRTHGFVSYRCFGKARSLHSNRTGRALGRYVATDREVRSVATQWPSGTCARSLCSDRVARALGRYVATERDVRSVATQRQDWIELGRYVATEWDVRSVATQRPSRTCARSLRSDRAVRMFGRCVVTELGLSMFRSSHSNLSVAGLDMFPLPLDNWYLVVRLRFEQDFTARLFVKISYFS